MDIFLRWFFGLGIFAIGIGWLFTFIFLKVLRTHIMLKADQRKEADTYKENLTPLDVHSWLIGFTERTFFTILVAFNMSATAVAMIAWVTLKMLCNWNILLRERGNITLRSLAWSALLGNMVSMLFALIGGLICRGSI